MDDTQIELAKLHNAASGQEEDGFLSGVGQAITKGIPLAVGSGLYSMYNTAASLGNVLGADIDKKDYGADVAAYDEDLGMYYQQHQQGVDVAGFVATSFIPGLGGIKALKMIQGGMAGKNAAAVSGFFRTKSQQYIEGTLAKIRASRNELFDSVTKDKIAALSFGAGEQALQGAAFETAVLLTMNQSPILAKPDEDYFTSLYRNSHSVVTAAAIQGAVGGFFGGASVLGKFKKAVQERDAANLASNKRTYVGESNLDVGTKFAMEYSYLANDKATFEAGKAAGTLTESQIVGFQKSLKHQEDTIRVNLTKGLLRNEEYPTGDGALADGLWKLITESSDDAGTASLITTAATKIERISGIDEPIVGARYTLGDRVLSPREIKNIKKRNKIAPEITDNPTEQQLTEWPILYDAYQDTSGNFHILEKSKYATKELQKSFQVKQGATIIKLHGDNQGRVTEFAYPVLGDLGEVSFKDGIMRVKGSKYPMPDTFDPIANDATDSSAQFLRAKLAPLGKDGKLEIPAGDLPTLEALALNGFKGDITYAGENLGLEAADILQQAKVEKIRELVAAGKDFDFISRALNVTRDFAETQRGDGFILGKLEDHTKPLYAKVSFDTTLLPDKFYVRGVYSLMNRAEMARQNNDKVSAVILGEDHGKLYNSQGVMLNLSTIPELGGAISFASGEYSSFASAMQQAGKVTNDVAKRRTLAYYQAAQAVEAQARSNKDAVIRLNMLTNLFRSGKEPFYRKEIDGDIYYIPKSLYKQIQADEATAGMIDPVTGNVGGSGVDVELLQKAIAEKKAFRVDFSKQDEQFADEYLQFHMKTNGERFQQKKLAANAIGKTINYESDRIYVPPIDTRKYSHVAFVKEKMDIGGGHVQEAGVIVAPDAASLEAKINQFRSAHGDKFDVFTGRDIKAYKEIHGEWESGSYLGDSLTDSTLRNEGLLYEAVPRTDDQIFNDFNRWHYNQEQALVRNAIELKYSQEFAELRAMADEFRAYNEDKFGPKDRRSSALANPYLKYINTALDYSGFDRYQSLWGKFNETVEGVGSKMIGAWETAFRKGAAGETDWVSANKIAEQYGFTPPYKNVMYEVVNPVIENRRALEPFVAKANGAVSTLTLGLDFLNSLVNVISFPVLATAEMSNLLRTIKDPKLLTAAAEMTSIAIPGTTHVMPTPMKLLTSSISRFFKDDGTLLKYYQEIGAIKTPLEQYKSVITSSAIPEAAAKSKEGFIAWSNDLVKKTAELGKTVTGHNKAEEMVRFMAADMMKQITDTLGVAASDAPAYINAFVNRVHGNYLASQRPFMFQGVVGQAISLFQTYQFNLAQNMIRYLGQDNKAAAAILLGMQNTIFGLQSNPAFYILNQAIGNSNHGKVDIMSGTHSVLGEDVYKWVMYGLGSNAIQTSLYNRGDLTPRYLTVVPTQLKDIPAISIPAKAISSFVDTASNIMKGGNVKASLLEGLSHFGANRPIAGLAQLAQGFRTSNNGDLLTAYNDLDTLTVAAKLAGGEELNRSLAFDAYYRNLGYRQKDREEVNRLGEAVKTTMYKNQSPDEDQVHSFLSQYVRSGGDPRTFNRWLQYNSKHANASQTNLLKRMFNSKAGRLQGQLMGADTEDFYFNPPVVSTDEP